MTTQPSRRHSIRNGVNAADLNDEIDNIYRWLSRLKSILENPSGDSSIGTFPATPHALLSATHSDAAAAAGVAGDLIYYSSGAWRRLAIGAASRVLVVSGGVPTWALLVNANIDAAAAIDWTKVSKTGSSLADLATRSASDLSSGTLPDARFPATLPAVSGVNLTNLDASDLASGTVPDARLSANVPLKNAANAFTAANSFANNALDLLVGQIQFPASQNASAGANVLDDYEEGTFTPTITGSGGASGQVYTAQDGYYIKIGRLVHVSFRVALSTLGTITTSAQLGGLPFTTANVTNLRGIATLNWANMTTALYVVEGQITPNVTTINILGNAAAAVSIGSLVQADFSNTSIIAGSVEYLATA